MDRILLVVQTQPPSARFNAGEAQRPGLLQDLAHITVDGQDMDADASRRTKKGLGRTWEVRFSYFSSHGVHGHVFDTCSGGIGAYGTGPIILILFQKQHALVLG